MNITNKLEETIGLDKLLHFSISLNLTMIIIMIANMWYGFSITLVLGLLKEVINSTQEDSKFSKKDIIANIIGILIGLLVINLFR